VSPCNSLLIVLFVFMYCLIVLRLHTWTFIGRFIFLVLCIYNRSLIVEVFLERQIIRLYVNNFVYGQSVVNSLLMDNLKYMLDI